MYRWYESDAEDYDDVVDVWSLGMILIDMVRPSAVPRAGVLMGLGRGLNASMSSL